MKAFFVRIWKEICLGYATVKKFIVKVLTIFYQPGTNPPKVSSKRVTAVALALGAVFELVKGDHMAFIVCILAMLVIYIVQAFSKT